MIGDVSDVKVFGNVLSYHFDVQALSIMDIYQPPANAAGLCWA